MSGTLVTSYSSTLVKVPVSSKPTDSNLLIMIDNHSPGKSTVSAKDGRRTERFAVPFAKAYDYQLNLLGYSYTEGQEPNKTLKRALPAAHPLYTSYICTEINDEGGMVFDGQYDSAIKDQYTIPKGAKYTYSLFDASFRPTNIYLCPDSAVAAIGGEHNRYISYKYSSKLEYLTRPFGAFTFAEGPGSLTTPKAAFQGQTISPEQKVDLEVTWHQVPEDYVSTNGVGATGLLTKINAGIGTVNSTEIWGFPAGTLLMLKPEIERYPCPLILNNWQGFGPQSQQTFYLDITFKFVWFDPPRASGSTPRGHNLKPWFGGTTATYYYYVSIDGQTTGRGVFPTYDYKKMFTYVLAP